MVVQYKRGIYISPSRFSNRLKTEDKIGSNYLPSFVGWLLTCLAPTCFPPKLEQCFALYLEGARQPDDVVLSVGIEFKSPNPAPKPFLKSGLWDIGLYVVYRGVYRRIKKKHCSDGKIWWPMTPIYIYIYNCTPRVMVHTISYQISRKANDSQHCTML